MTEREFWTRKLREAERELDAATRRSEVDAAAKRFMLAKAELKRLKAPKRRPTGGSRSADASS